MAGIMRTDDSSSRHGLITRVPDRHLRLHYEEAMGNHPLIMVTESSITKMQITRLRLDELTVLGRRRRGSWSGSRAHERWLQVVTFVATIKDRRGLTASCFKEFAHEHGCIDREVLRRLLPATPISGLGERHRGIGRAG